MIFSDIFKTPLILAAIPVILAAVIFMKKRRNDPAVTYADVQLLPSHKGGWRLRLLNVPFYLRLAALICLLVALAGPRQVRDYQEYWQEGIDIVLAIDLSGSMAAEDFVVKGERRNRLAVVKDVVRDFIQKRRNDRIGIVAFARNAYTVSPLTLDEDWLMSHLERLRLGLIEDGTAVGSGLSSAVLRLKESDAESRVVILLTDGVNNAGDVKPLEAAEAAESLGIRAYTVGAGKRGPVPYPVGQRGGRTFYQRVEIDIDEETLTRIAQITGGEYFRATDTESLRHVYEQIDRMETTRIQHTGYRDYRYRFAVLIMSALVLILIALILENTLLFVLP
ncbi:MAG: vWA domain-containing protein [Candidatus Omnitrophota bacterium]